LLVSQVVLLHQIRKKNVVALKKIGLKEIITKTLFFTQVLFGNTKKPIKKLTVWQMQFLTQNRPVKNQTKSFTETDKN
jgi:hypothetical protein